VVLVAASPGKVGGAYMKAVELDRVVSDMNANVAAIGTNNGLSWLLSIPPSLIAAADRAAQLPRSQLRLIAGSDALPPGLVAALPPLTDGRAPPAALKSKNFFGGSLSWTGYNTHLVPPDVCAVLPVSERFFLWWDDASKHLRVQPDNTDFSCYPTPLKDGSAPYQIKKGGSKPQLMLSTTDAGSLMLMLKDLRETFSQHIDLALVELSDESPWRRYVVAADARQSILNSLEGHGEVGSRARAAMSSMLGPLVHLLQAGPPRPSPSRPSRACKTFADGVPDRTGPDFGCVYNCRTVRV
jgi:hypothetical protein